MRKICKIKFQQLDETKLNRYQLGKLKKKNRTKQNKNITKQIQTEEAGIARKTHEIAASLEQSFSKRPIDSTSNRLYKVPFAGHTRANSVRGRTL